jgi:hypothetical protein
MQGKLTKCHAAWGKKCKKGTGKSHEKKELRRGSNLYAVFWSRSRKERNLRLEPEPEYRSFGSGSGSAEVVKKIKIHIE